MKGVIYEIQVASLFFTPGCRAFRAFPSRRSRTMVLRAVMTRNTHTRCKGPSWNFEFENPHSAIIFEVKDKNGAAQRWHAELGGANALRRADGWERDTLKPGDKITVIGPRNKNGSFDMNLSHESKITMTDTGKTIHNSFKSEQGQ